MINSKALAGAFEDAQGEANTVLETAYGKGLTFIPANAVAARPGGGCLRVVPSKYEPNKLSYVYDEKEGNFCWASKYDRSNLYALEPQFQGGISMFDLFYDPVYKDLKPESLTIDQEFNQQLDGFFGSVGKFFKKAVRYTGAAIVAPYTSARTTRRMFGLSKRESRGYEKYAKISRASLLLAGGMVASKVIAAKYASGLAAKSAAAKAAAAKAAGSAGAKAAATKAVAAQAAARAAALSPGKALITKVGSNILAFTKNPAGALIVSKYAAKNFARVGPIPPQGIVVDGTLGDRPLDFGLPAPMAGGGGLPPMSEDAPFMDDAMLRDAVAEQALLDTPQVEADQKKKQMIALTALIGLAVAVSLATRGR